MPKLKQTQGCEGRLTGKKADNIPCEMCMEESLISVRPFLWAMEGTLVRWLKRVTEGCIRKTQKTLQADAIDVMLCLATFDKRHTLFDLEGEGLPSSLTSPYVHDSSVKCPIYGTY